VADRLEVFHVTAGGIQLSDVTTDLEFVDGIVEQVDIMFPDGCLGNVRLRLLYGGTQVIPRGTSQLRANNETVKIPLSGLFPTGSAWQVAMSNGDFFEHEVEIRFYVREIPAPAPSLALPVPVE
jgi:hypothetical protein